MKKEGLGRMMLTGQIEDKWYRGRNLTSLRKWMAEHILKIKKSNRKLSRAMIVYFMKR